MSTEGISGRLVRGGLVDHRWRPDFPVRASWWRP